MTPIEDTADCRTAATVAHMQHDHQAASIVVIEPSHGWIRIGVRDLWHYRDLLYILAWRDIKVRYKQTVLGAAWAIIQPVVTMVIFTLIFGRVAHLPSEGVPYALFTLAALLPWSYFAYVLQQSGESLVGNSSMITKVYFPRLILPLSAALAGLMDLAIAFGVFAILAVILHGHIDWAILTLPLWIIYLIAASLSIGIWMSALNVLYRDVRYTIPFLLQVGIYVSPVAYSARLVTGVWHVLYACNPMVGIIEGFRWSLLGVHFAGWTLVPSVVMTVVLLAGGLIYFRRMEQTFADKV